MTTRTAEGISRSRSGMSISAGSSLKLLCSD